MCLSQRVMLFDEASQPLLDDVGIDLRGGDVGMAEKLLHRAQVGAPLQEMAGDERKNEGGEPLPVRLAAPARGKMGLNPLPCRLVEREEPLAPAFALDG